MIGIYKIENLINHKIYIGQSIHIERRWSEHCFPSAKSLISRAIKKYGKENFSFQVLEECQIEELAEKEIYYIKQFDCVVPKGYNVKDYMDNTETTYTFYDKDTFFNIVSDIKTSFLSFQEIGEKYNITVRLVYYINRGDVHYIPTETYPLREIMDTSKIKKYCIDCGKEISKGAIRCIDCSHKKQRRTIRPSREELKKLIRTKSFVELSRIYGVSDNAIRKWCKSYKLPNKKTDINKISDEDWLVI